MRELFKEIISDFEQQPIPVLIPRQIDLPKLPAGVRKAFVFIGMRRTGKTYCLYQLMQALLEKGLDKEKIVYINFADERLATMKISDFQSILDAYFELKPRNVDASDLHFFFDEIQVVDGWENFIRRLLDSEKMSLYLSGSSAKLLSTEMATNLRGRTIVREVFPFSFNEYLTALDVNLPELLQFGTKNKAVARHYVQEYFVRGGFPEIIKADRPLHRELLQGYVESVIYRDIVERYDVPNIHVLKRLLIQSIQNSAGIVSVNKSYRQLKSQGYTVSKNILYDYFFADCIVN